MFTVRVDRGRSKREVYACARYIVSYDPDRRARVTLVGASDGRGGEMADPVHVIVGHGDCAFVMNGNGITCDIVRVLPEPVGKGG